MGGIVSKITPEVPLDHGFNESFNRLKNSFNRTPKYKIIDDKMIDPRSATVEINRTPLCLLDLAVDEDSTPVARNRKKSKRRSLKRSSDTESSRADISSKSFEFSSTSFDSINDVRTSPWEPRDDFDSNFITTCDDKDEKETATYSEATDNNYGIVVEELRECLTKVSLTPVYPDEDSLNKNMKSKMNENKDFKKKFWTPDHPLDSKSPRERTPLGLVNSNIACQRLNSSALYRGGKIWRGPSDERAKLQGENTPPPNFPPFGSPKSAPPTNRHMHFSLK